MEYLILDKIRDLTKKLENQISKNDSYENIYETSAMIDHLILLYYKESGTLKKI